MREQKIAKILIIHTAQTGESLFPNGLGAEQHGKKNLKIEK